MLKIIMKLDALYNKAIKKWPDYVKISDGVDHGVSYKFPELINLYDNIENEIDADDVWMELGCWAFHQALHRYAKEQYFNGKSIVKISDVSKSTFDEMLRENLADDSWDIERIAYFNANP